MCGTLGGGRAGRRVINLRAGHGAGARGGAGEREGPSSWTRDGFSSGPKPSTSHAPLGRRWPWASLLGGGHQPDPPHPGHCSPLLTQCPSQCLLVSKPGNVGAGTLSSVLCHTALRSVFLWPPWLGPSPHPLVPHIQPRGPPSCSLLHSPDPRPVPTPPAAPSAHCMQPRPLGVGFGPSLVRPHLPLQPGLSSPSIPSLVARLCKHTPFSTPLQGVAQAAASAGMFLLLSVMTPVQTSGSSSKPQGCLVHEAALDPPILGSPAALWTRTVYLLALLEPSGLWGRLHCCCQSSTPQGIT